jgi:mercuric ion transport protein
MTGKELDMIDAISLQKARDAFLSYLSLFASFGTLLCCALPSLLALVGLGATVAGLLSAMPWLVNLSHHKNWVFLFSGLMIAANFVYTRRVAPNLRAQGSACSPAASATCEAASTMSRVMLWISALIYATGVFSAYLLGPLLMRFAN